jgi:hypothetical protein
MVRQHGDGVAAELVSVGHRHRYRDVASRLFEWNLEASGRRVDGHGRGW